MVKLGKRPRTIVLSDEDDDAMESSPSQKFTSPPKFKTRPANDSKFWVESTALVD